MRQPDSGVLAQAGVGGSPGEPEMRDLLFEMHAHDSALYTVLSELSGKELSAAWPALCNLSGEVTGYDTPLMAWGVTGPEPGLLLACTSGFLFLANDDDDDTELWPLQSIRGYTADESLRRIFVELDHMPSVIVRTVEDEIDILADVVSLMVKARNRRQLARAFEEWLAT